MDRLSEVGTEIEEIDERLAAMPPDADDRADLLARRQELTAEAAELAGETAPQRAVEPEPVEVEEDPDTLAGG